MSSSSERLLGYKHEEQTTQNDWQEHARKARAYLTHYQFDPDKTRLSELDYRILLFVLDIQEREGACPSNTLIGYVARSHGSAESFLQGINTKLTSGGWEMQIVNMMKETADRQGRPYNKRMGAAYAVRCTDSLLEGTDWLEENPAIQAIIVHFGQKIHGMYGRGNSGGRRQILLRMLRAQAQGEPFAMTDIARLKGAEGSSGELETVADQWVRVVNKELFYMRICIDRNWDPSRQAILCTFADVPWSGTEI